MITATYIFNDVYERDMDLLIAEGVSCSKQFLHIFLDVLGIHDASVDKIHLSKSDEDGETDITVVLDVEGNKHALLIEDKIDATAQPDQAGRYLKRGNRGIEKGEYISYDVFIVAPQEYLSNNEEAAKYPHSISYERIAELFSQKDDPQSRFKYQQIMQAIRKEREGYQVVENQSVTEFWRHYITACKENFPELNLASKYAKRGSNASWPRYRTSYPNVYILHKMEFGYIDLTFKGSSKNANMLEDMIDKMIGGIHKNNAEFHVTGKSCALRLCVPILDTKNGYYEQEQEAITCFNELRRMYSIAAKLDFKPILRLLQNDKQNI